MRYSLRTANEACLLPAHCSPGGCYGKTLSSAGIYAALIRVPWPQPRPLCSPKPSTAQAVPGMNAPALKHTAQYAIRRNHVTHPGHRTRSSQRRPARNRRAQSANLARRLLINLASVPVLLHCLSRWRFPIGSLPLLLRPLVVPSPRRS